jgi:Thymidylate kinase
MGSEGIKRDLLAGTTIIVDRYIYSGVAFSAAKVHQYFLEHGLIAGVGLCMVSESRRWPSAP